MAYSKLHSSIVNSSLWGEPDHVRLLFITLLAMCDRDGYVYGSRPGIERLANIKWKFDNDDDVDPWLVLMSPDPNSSDTIRAPENEGRRIEEVSGGFRLLNFEYYRGLRNDDDRREQNRRAQEKFRSKSTSASVSHDKPKSAGESRRNPPSAASKPISEAETEAEAEAHTQNQSVCVPKQARGPGPAELDIFRTKLCKLYNQSSKRRWSHAEDSTLFDLAKAPEFPGELDEIINYKNKLPPADVRFFPNSIDRLLSQWTSTLDRARTYSQRTPLTLIEKQLRDL